MLYKIIQIFSEKNHAIVHFISFLHNVNNMILCLVYDHLMRLNTYLAAKQIIYHQYIKSTEIIISIFMTKALKLQL